MGIKRRSGKPGLFDGLVQFVQILNRDTVYFLLALVFKFDLTARWP